MGTVIRGEMEEFPPLISSFSSSGEKGGQSLAAKVGEAGIISGIVAPAFGDLGEYGNPISNNWRTLFPIPRPVIPQTKMKFTSPIEVNGKLVVAAESENFSTGMKNCEDLVVGFVVGNHLSYSAVKLAVTKLWKLKKEVSIRLHDGCAYIFKFSDGEDRKKVLEIGSFYISGQLFTLRPWSPLIEKSVSLNKSVPIWAMIHGVPLHMWNCEGLSLISSYLGRPILADDCTINQTRLAYARICIEIDLEFSYPESIPLVIDGKIAMDLPVEYQWKAPKCDICMVFGHTVKNCAKKAKSRWTPRKRIVTQLAGRIGSKEVGAPGADIVQENMNVEANVLNGDSGSNVTIVNANHNESGGVVERNLVLEVTGQTQDKNAGRGNIVTIVDSNGVRMPMGDDIAKNSIGAKTINVEAKKANGLNVNSGSIANTVNANKPYESAGVVETNSSLEVTGLIQDVGNKNEVSGNIVTIVNSNGDNIAKNSNGAVSVNTNTRMNKVVNGGAVGQATILGSEGVLDKQVSFAEKNVNSGAKKLGCSENAKFSPSKKSSIGAPKCLDKSANGGGVKPTGPATCSESSARTVGVQSSEIGAHEEWTQAKGKKICTKKSPSPPKKNPFIMLSDFPFQSSSRFPIDRKKEPTSVITPSKNRFQIDESEDLEDREFERNLKYESIEDQYSKKKERELHRLQWDGNPKITKEDGKNLGRGCRSQAKK